MSKATKSVNLPAEFLRAAAGHEQEALAYQLFAAFGVTLEDCRAAVVKAIINKDAKVLVLMAAAGVQIRGNVTFVSRDYGGLKAQYPALVIEGNREVKDTFNFGALHVCGHVLAHLTTRPLGRMILSKAGDCVLGGTFPANEAGSINKSIYESWDPEMVKTVRASMDEQRPKVSTYLDVIVDGFSAWNDSFKASMAAGAAPSRPSVAPPATPAAPAPTTKAPAAPATTGS